MSNLNLFCASRIDRKEEKCTYTWTVSNLNLLQEANLTSIDSPQFLINNKGWYLSIRVKSLNVKQAQIYPHYEEFDSLYLDLLQDEENDTINFHYSFSILNEKNRKCINSDALNENSGSWKIKKSLIFDDSSENPFPNDTLKIICELKFVTYPQINLESMSNGDFISATSSNITNNKYLENLFLEDQHSDVRLVTQCGKELKAHKVILASRSQTFQAMFNHDMVENNLNIVKIPDVDYEVLKQMLRFIYMGQVENMKTVATDLFIAADKYDIQDLKGKCTHYIAESITVENVIPIFELAAKYNAEQLKTRAMHFVKSNIAQIMKTDIFKEKLQVLGPLYEMIELLIH